MQQDWKQATGLLASDTMKMGTEDVAETQPHKTHTGPWDLLQHSGNRGQLQLGDGGHSTGSENCDCSTRKGGGMSKRILLQLRNC